MLSIPASASSHSHSDPRLPATPSPDGSPDEGVACAYAEGESRASPRRRISAIPRMRALVGVRLRGVGDLATPANDGGDGRNRANRGLRGDLGARERLAI